MIFSAAATATTGSTSTTSAAKPEDITWQDLENKINKWNTDIEQQVSVFIKQVVSLSKTHSKNFKAQLAKLTTVTQIRDKHILRRLK